MERFDFKTDHQTQHLVPKTGRTVAHRRARLLQTVHPRGHNLRNGSLQLFRVMNIFYVYTDLKVLTATIYLTVTDVTVLVKSCLFIRNVRTLKQLTVTINCDRFQPKTMGQKDLAKRGLSEWKFTYLMFWALVFMSLLMWTISPLIDSSGKDRQLPLPAWYPYNTTISPYYEITYVCR
jgi:hypothetical protein